MFPYTTFDYNSALKQADVPRDQAAEILGHDKGKDVTYGRYGKPAEAKRQLEVIKKLTFSLNLGFSVYI